MIECSDHQSRVISFAGCERSPKLYRFSSLTISVLEEFANELILSLFRKLQNGPALCVNINGYGVISN